MKSLYSVENIRDICNRYNFSLSKKYGQNFLLDPNIVSKISKAIDISKEDVVIEIGVGFGVLTREISKSAKKVFAIDIDKRLEPILEETLDGCDNVYVIISDILKLDIKKLLDDIQYDRLIFIGNLPYYITTPIIFNIIEYDLDVSSLVFMMQKEVGERILSSQGSKEYGIISPILNYYYDVEEITHVSNSVFYPRPKVDSIVLGFTSKDRVLSSEEEIIFKKVVKGSFANRRKTIVNSLSSYLSVDKEYLRDVLLGLDIDPGRRGETLSLDDFLSLTKEVSKGFERK